MDKYLIALDMDGTLLNDKKEICQKTKEYLKQLQKDGNIIVIASGRPIRAIKKYYDELELTSPIVCYNGANIIAPNNPNFQEISFAFPKEIIKQIYQDLKDKYIDNVMCETNDKLWLIQDDEILGEFFWIDNMELIKGNISETLTENPMTMIIRSISKNHNDKIIEAVKKNPSINIRFWSAPFDSYSEIYFNHISKAYGLKYIAKYFNIPSKNIIAIGDAQNDIEMFSLAGISIAMKNADEDTKKHATIVSEFDNNNDGIMYALKKIIK